MRKEIIVVMACLAVLMGCQAERTVPDTQLDVVKALPPLDGNDICKVTNPGTGGGILIKGFIINGPIANLGWYVLINSTGIIECVDNDCSSSPSAATATIIDCNDASVSPGLINPHDHINWNISWPDLSATYRYDQRNDWRNGCREHTELKSYSDTDKRRVAWNELRQAISGTTSVAGSGGVAGLLRNFNKDGYLQEWPSAKMADLKVDYNVFPLADYNHTQFETSCTGYSDRRDTPAVLHNDCYIPHVAEGVDYVARNEFLCLSGRLSDRRAGSYDLVNTVSAFIHTVGTLAPDAKRMSDRKNTVIWSPRSNVSLYGNTAQIHLYKTLGVPLALSTDWLPSGSMNMLRELNCALSLNNTYFANTLSNTELWQMVTNSAAYAVKAHDRIGRLSPGYVADIAIFNSYSPGWPDAFFSVVNATSEDVALVLKAGRPLFGESAVVNALRSKDPCYKMETMCGLDRSVCLPEYLGTYDELAKHNLIQNSPITNAPSYRLYYCKGETPKGEPSCTPYRQIPDKVCGNYTGEPTTNDIDGDGIPNDLDNCPSIFNPPRPLDGAYEKASGCKQANCDGDTFGDACDSDPFSGGSTCSYYQPKLAIGNVCAN
ncbi:MAG: amidohydrolase family protein [Thermodesulfovibrionales bacterium]|nr:amidohydrolase family protein [Thermodesulfovibrionales bacterium]